MKCEKVIIPARPVPTIRTSLGSTTASCTSYLVVGVDLKLDICLYSAHLAACSIPLQDTATIAKMSSLRVAPPQGMRHMTDSDRKSSRMSMGQRRLTRGKSMAARGSLGRSNASLAVDPLQLLERKDGENANFGSIRFPGRQRPVRWVRCSVESEIQSLMRVLTEKWELKRPGAIISVMGPDVIDSVFSVSAQQILSKGLQGASSRASAWVITGGAQTGVAGLVGKAMRDAEQPCIGIVSWEALAERQRLEATLDGQVHMYGRDPAGSVAGSNVQEHVERRARLADDATAPSGPPVPFGTLLLHGQPPHAAVVGHARPAAQTKRCALARLRLPSTVAVAVAFARAGSRGPRGPPTRAQPLALHLCRPWPQRQSRWRRPQSRTGTHAHTHGSCEVAVPETR